MEACTTEGNYSEYLYKLLDNYAIIIVDEVHIHLLYDSVDMGGNYFNGTNPRRHKRNLSAIYRHHNLYCRVIPDRFC